MNRCTTRRAAGGLAIVTALALTACEHKDEAGATTSTAGEPASASAETTTVTQTLTSTRAGAPASQVATATTGTGAAVQGKKVKQLDPATVAALPAGPECDVTPRLEWSGASVRAVTADGAVTLPARPAGVSRHPRGTVVLGVKGEIWFVPAGSTSPRTLHAAGPGPAYPQSDTSPDGRQVAYAAGNEFVVIDAETGAERSRTRVDAQDASVAWVASGFVYPKDSTLVIQKPGTQEKRTVAINPGFVPVGMPGDRVATVGDSGVNQVVDAGAGRVVRDQPADGWFVEWSPSGRTVLLGDELVDPRTGATVHDTPLVVGEYVSDTVTLSDDALWVDYALSGPDRTSSEKGRVWIRCSLSDPFTCTKGARR